MKKNLIHPSLNVVRKPPLNYDEMHPSKTNFIRLAEIIPPIYAVEIKNAFVSPFGIVYKNGLVVNESVYSMFKPHLFLLSFYKKIFLRKTVKIKGDCIVGHNSYYQNYYHWLLEAMPRLFLLKDKAPELTLILNSKAPNFIKQYVSFFEFKEIVYIEDDKIAYVDKIMFTTFTARGLAMHEPIIRNMVKWLFEINDITQNSNQSKKIFITRKNVKHRRLINQDEVIAYLITKGFEIVTLEDLTIKEQMQLFADSKYVIGTQGAGMANMIYSTQGKLLITIIHEEHGDDAYFNQTSLNNTSCYYFQCKGVGNNEFKNNDDIIVNMNNFIEVCEKYI
jgi:capsular polysaccharide biosynthesis protein